MPMNPTRGEKPAPEGLIVYRDVAVQFGDFVGRGKVPDGGGELGRTGLESLGYTPVETVDGQTVYLNPATYNNYMQAGGADAAATLRVLTASDFPNQRTGYPTDPRTRRPVDVPTHVSPSSTALAAEGRRIFENARPTSAFPADFSYILDESVLNIPGSKEKLEAAGCRRVTPESVGLPRGGLIWTMPITAGGRR